MNGWCQIVFQDSGFILSSDRSIESIFSTAGSSFDSSFLVESVFDLAEFIR